MSLFKGKKILLGITGGIAAYKIPLLVRNFKSLGAEVKIVMTPVSQQFVSPLVLSTLSENPVLSELVDEKEQWNNHVELALWADFYIIAPATSNTIASMSHGICNNLLLATYFSSKCPVYIAPAMDLDMYKHPTTLKNIDYLKNIGIHIIPATKGFLASGLQGEGRMEEPDNIVAFIENNLKKSLPLNGKKILISGGPTYEPIDPVRFIGNHSSGKMGYALAKAAKELGGEVSLVMGPSSLNISELSVQTTCVETSEEMKKAMISQYKNADIVISAAAVSDFRPKNVASQKIKKNTALNEIPLEACPDILLELGKQKKNQYLVGFALETENEKTNALKKMKAKNLDAIVLNSLNDKGAGFNSDTNKVDFYSKKGASVKLNLRAKTEIAKGIFKEIIKEL